MRIGWTGFWAFVKPNPNADEQYGAPLSGLEAEALLRTIVALGRP